MEFPGVIIKATWYFYWWSRKNCGIPKGLDFRTFSGWSFVLSVISRCEIRNLRIPGLSKKYVWNSRNTHVNFSWVMIFDLGISKVCHTNLQNFCRISRSECLFSLEFVRIKVTNLKFSGEERDSEKYILNPRLDFVLNGLIMWNFFLMLYVLHLGILYLTGAFKINLQCMCLLALNTLMKQLKIFNYLKF